MKTILIVDGYNVIHSQAEKMNIPIDRLEEARERLIEALNSYSGYIGSETVLVFDAYQQPDLLPREEMRGRVKVVFTEKNQTADAYIEKLVFGLPRLYTVIVVTSDFTIQRMVLANGGERMSSRELVDDMADRGDRIAGKVVVRQSVARNQIADYMNEDVLEVMKKMRKGDVKDD